MDKRTLVKYIYAFTFGDGCITYPVKNKPHHKVQARLSVTHIVDNADYILWKKSILEELTNVHMYENVGRDGRRNTLTLHTNRHPLYTAVRERMYYHGRKTIDPHFLKHLDWEVLAIFYMDDGCYKNGTKEEAIYLSTNCFTYAEQEMFCFHLFKKFGLKFTINKHMGSYRLRLSSKDVDKFMQGVKPFILPSFQYKLSSECLAPEMGDDIVRPV
jgi:hypothetical protein